MDEPTSVLSPQEIVNLFKVLKIYQNLDARFYILVTNFTKLKK